MKKQLINLFLLVFISVNAWSLNHEVLLDNARNIDCKRIVVPVVIKNFSNVGAISLKFDYDQTKLEFEDVALNSSISSAISKGENGHFALAFFGDAINLTDGEVLFEVRFKVIGTGPNSTNLEWLNISNTGNCEIAGPGGLPVYPANFVNSEPITISEELEADAQFEPPLCENSVTTVFVTATGGIPPYSGIGEFLVSAGNHIFTVIDANGCTDEVSVVVPHPEPATLQIDFLNVSPDFPVEISSYIKLMVGYSSNFPVDILVDWDDNTFSNLSNELSGNVTLNHFYDTPDVYTLEVKITNICGDVVSKKYENIVIIDPDAGFVTGGGWYMSPSGAYCANTKLKGKANFGFIVKYQKGKTVPTGNTEFQFHAACMNFKSTNYEWLVITGKKARFKGSGTINGKGNYGFIITVTDDCPDKFRIKIWNNATGKIVYDNQIGSPDNANPNTVIGGGSIVIHNTESKSVVITEITSVAEELIITVYPNPFTERLHFGFVSPANVNARIDLFDMNGRLVKTIFEQQVEANQYYEAEFKPETIISAFYMYRITLGDLVQNGKIIFKKE